MARWRLIVLHNTYKLLHLPIWILAVYLSESRDVKPGQLAAARLTRGE
jgi:hypothetical protein